MENNEEFFFNESSSHIAQSIEKSTYVAQPVLYRVSGFQISSQAASADAKEFITSLINTKNDEILTTEFVKVYIDLMWKKV
jgi:hypothetical protein